MKIEIRLNGEACEIPEPVSIAELLEPFDLPNDRVAVERNRSIVPKQQWESVQLAQGDEIEVAHFVGGGSGNGDAFVIAGRTFKSRLIVGTGKYSSNQVMAEAHRRSGTEDRKSTRLNSSHGYISYAVFCLKKKKKATQEREDASKSRCLLFQPC